MNAPLTRRALLGATAAIGATTLPAVALSTTTPPQTMSPEATALLREFHDVAGRFNAAMFRLDEAQTATVYVPEPEALFLRDGDLWKLSGIPPQRHWSGGRFTYGKDEVIEKIRELPTSDANRPRVERRNEIVDAWDRWQADKEAACHASGETAAGEHYQPIAEEHDAFVVRLTHMRTSDPDIMKIKAAVVRNMWSDDPDRFDAAIERVTEDWEDADDILCFSLMRDIMHQLGGAFRVVR